MENNKQVRVIDDLGRIVLPQEVREAVGFGKNTSVEIRVDEAGREVILKRHTFSCVYCGATENLKQYEKKHICAACRKAIAGL